MKLADGVTSCSWLAAVTFFFSAAAAQGAKITFDESGVLQIDGKKTYQIGIPIHWGYRGIAEDAGKTDLTPANQLSPAATDPNAYTPEFKGFLVKVERA